MNDKEMEDIEAVGNKIVPTTWMGSNMLPMEYAVVPTSYAHFRSPPNRFPVSPSLVCNPNFRFP